ncbi:MAG: ABC transporter ATP-binding protein/permease [Spirochaetes bacterium]|nr:ABC transporter ATP-binding protein/permease [Spirochaetota bacterium]MBU0955104.1 ABC transporter ATP-binding protein/permease [Spirochaetota bacterium]
MTKRAFFLRYARDQRWLLTALTLLTLTATLATLVTPQLVRRFLDAAGSGAPLSRLLVIAASFAGISLLVQGLNLVRTYLGELVAWRTTNRLREDLARHCLRLDMNFHKTHKPGELMERLDNDVNETRRFFSSLFTELLAILPLFAGVVIALAIENRMLGLAAFILSLATLWAFPAINTKRVPHMHYVREVHALLAGDQQEWLQGREDIQASSSVDVMINRLHRRYSQRYKASLRLLPYHMGSNLLPGLILFLLYLLAYIFSAGFRSYVLPVSSFAMVLLYIGKLQLPLEVMQHSFTWIAAAQAAFDRITLLLDEKPVLHQGSARLQPEAGLGLSCEQLGFAYDDQTVLHDISFTLQPGEQLGLLGRTGSGKTTLTRLIMHLYEPGSGSIYLDDGSKRFRPQELAPDCLNSLCAMVTQEVELLNASIRDNLTMYNKNISDQAVLQAIDSVSMSDWLERQPKGLDSRLTGTSGLSAGEAQLLSLARIFLRNPSLVIMDEASSRLDLATERKMQLAVQRLLHRRTAIIIAHRLDTVQHVDRLLILDQGRIIEQGSRAALLADSGSRFNHLLKTGLAEVLA